jgi:hypothetical protein
LSATNKEQATSNWPAKLLKTYGITSFINFQIIKKQIVRKRIDHNGITDELSIALSNL